MSPARSKAHLAFVRSLPCCVSGRTFGIEAAHVGARGMGQKSSDLETIPLNVLFHREQHRIGLRAFVKTYQLDIPAILAMLQRRGKMVVWQGCYIGYWGDGYWGDQTIVLGYVQDGWERSFKIFRDRVREILSSEIQARVRRQRGFPANEQAIS
jgi:hypothetical protein